MLDHLDIKAFIGGNLGVPLSEAACQCLMSSPLRPFQVKCCLPLLFRCFTSLFCAFPFSMMTRCSLVSINFLRFPLKAYMGLLLCITFTHFQVAVVEVSSYQLEIPNKNFHPSVSGCWSFCTSMTTLSLNFLFSAHASVKYDFFKPPMGP